MTTPAGRLLTAEDKTMKIGFVGLGIMGSRMAANLRKHGYALVVFNRTRAKAAPLLEQGATLAESPAELAAHADVVFTMLSQPEAVEQAALGSDGRRLALRSATLLSLNGAACLRAQT